MADDNMEGDMEVETNPARSAYSSEINVVINGKTKQNMQSFYLQSNLCILKKKKKKKNPENLNLVP